MICGEFIEWKDQLTYGAGACLSSSIDYFGRLGLP